MKKKRKFRNAELATKSRENQLGWSRLLEEHEIIPKKKTSPKFVPMIGKPATQKMLEFQASLGRIPKQTSLPTKPDLLVNTRCRPQYTGEMAEREKKAQQEIAKKKLQVAPISNKAGYQLITDPADFKTMGRKV
jgi:hypothetical protein